MTGSGAMIKEEKYTWEKDTGLVWISRPRLIESLIIDGSDPAKSRKSRVTYSQTDGVWLPITKDEYQGNTTTIYLRMTMTYTSYPTQHILGLPVETSTYAGPGTTLLARTTNAYDQAGSYTDTAGLSLPYLALFIVSSMPARSPEHVVPPSGVG